MTYHEVMSKVCVICQCFDALLSVSWSLLYLISYPIRLAYLLKRQNVSGDVTFHCFVPLKVFQSVLTQVSLVSLVRKVFLATQEIQAMQGQQD